MGRYAHFVSVGGKKRARNGSGLSNDSRHEPHGFGSRGTD
jgi:hypothetical protein